MKWIAVKDELPKEDGLCLVTAKGHVGPMVIVAEFCAVPFGIESGRWLAGHFLIDNENAHVFYDATHWMPLPEPGALEGS